jgi:hypothetical protein
VIALSTGLVTLNGSLGSVKVSGTAPNVTANVATVEVGSENVAVPTLKVHKPGDPAPAASTAPAK